MRASAFRSGLLAVLVAAVGLPASAGTDGTAVPVPGSAGTVGRWVEPRAWPVVAIHAALLPTGEVLHYSYDDYYLGAEARLWDPRTDEFTDVDWKPNLFCSGHSFLADGSVYVTGGIEQVRCPTQGIRDAHLFEPWTRSWKRLGDMRAPRYYPTNLTLGTGQVLILAGSNRNCLPASTAELYTPGRASERLPGAKRRLELYPRVHLLPSGLVAHVGPEPQTSLLAPYGGWNKIGRTRLGEHRWEGFSFLVPGKPYEVMTCGGFGEFEGASPTERCERIDFSANPPVWREAAPMHYPRAHANAVLLPDGQVLVVGGGRNGLYDESVRNAELYHPGRDEWTLLPAQRYNRPYHSTALLLPDGRVISAGSDDHEDDHAHDHGPASGGWAEIYWPAYLFRGPRPAVRKMDDLLFYGQSFKLKAKQAQRIVAITLIRPSTVTHSVNTDQRLVRLQFEWLKGNRIRARIPGNPNELPPGYYMLFLINDRGASSEARWVQIVRREEE